MTRDLKGEKYSELMLALMGGYKVMSVADYLTMPPQVGNVAVLRHDVERMPERAAGMALIEKRLGLRTTYYFRWDPKAIYWAGTGQDRHGNFPEMQVTEVRLYGHEVGYLPADGEDLSDRLARLRTLAPVATSVTDVPGEDLLGGPFSPAFSDFFGLTAAGGKWKASNGERLRGTDSVIGLLTSKSHPLVMLSIRPDRWQC